MKKRPLVRHALRVLVLAGTAALGALGVSSPAQALVQVTLDAETLSDFLRTVTPPKLIYSLPAGGDIALELGNVRVIGFDPSAGNGRGHILTSLTLRIPALGLAFPVEPRLSVELETKDGLSLCVLRFEKLTVPLVATGALDISSLMPVYRLPAESAFTLSLRQGDVQVKSRLVETRLGADGIRLGFDLNIGPAKEK